MYFLGNSTLSLIYLTVNKINFSRLFHAAKGNPIQNYIHNPHHQSRPNHKLSPY